MMDIHVEPDDGWDDGSGRLAAIAPQRGVLREIGAEIERPQCVGVRPGGNSALALAIEE